MTPRGPIDTTRTPRFAGPPTFALLPRLDEVTQCDVVIAGFPFDAGTSYRPGARFGPAAVRAGSRLLRPWHAELAVAPFGTQQVADAGDVACNPFSIDESIAQIEAGARALLGGPRGAGSAGAGHLLAIGGDHTIALPLLRATNERFGPVALVHFDAHLDTWDTYFGAPVTHGTPFRRAAEEGLFLNQASMHIGIRGPVYAQADLEQDAELGFRTVRAMELEDIGIAGVVRRIRERVGDAPLYISIDIDVLDPAHAPGTGTPEAGGLTSRELLGILRGLAGLNLVGADVVEVSPAYDHAELTTIAAAHVCYELLALLALTHAQAG
ncbi:MAG TPA: agmatinase [Streptosporangiaceae bacterium]|nr:agmatinase [Streptosporangiaceae bacterium]